MSGSTITTSVTHGIVLSTSGSYASPLTIAATGGVTASTGYAVFGPNTQAWTVANYGTVLNSSGFGIELLNGGSLNNTGTGLIQGDTGVYITGAAGTVTNSGTINGTNGSGIDLGGGGYVGNTGLIQGVAGGVSAGTVVNSGTIFGTMQPAIPSAATVVNSGRIQGTGPFVDAIHGSDEVINSGTIIGFQVYANSIDNMAAGLIKTRAWVETVTNLGTMTTNGAGTAITSLDGGSIYNSGLISGADAIGISGGGGVVINSGTIQGGIGGGVDLNAGGTISNMGLIEGGFDRISGDTGTVSNFGTIVSEFLELQAGGYLNNSGNILQGGVSITGGAGTIINTGTISGGNYGVYLSVGTVIDSGTIIGAGGAPVAVKFGGSGNLLVLEQGYSLFGSAYGGTGPTNTLELSGALGAVAVDYNGRPLTNFEDVLFGGAGDETLLITNNTTLPGTISGFTLTSDIVDLTQVGSNATLANGGTVSGSHQLTASGSGGTVVLQLDATDATVFKAVSDLGTGIDITPACFCRGTLILTERGEVAIEDLAIRDRVVTLSGALRAIKWVGHRAYDGRFAARNRRILPIRVVAGALAPGVPARDLLLSPEHALYLDGALAPVGQLVNGATIRQEERVERVEYFHIELDRHDIILANGAPAETYVDCDNRMMFHNAAQYADLFPEDERPRWRFCAPRLAENSEDFAALRARLIERAALAFGGRRRSRLDPAA